MIWLACWLQGAGACTVCWCERLLWVFNVYFLQIYVMFLSKSNLRGGVVVSISDPHRHVVVGAPSSIEPAGDQDGSRIFLDVKVFFLIATWEQKKKNETRKRWMEKERQSALFHQVFICYSMWGHESGGAQLSGVISRMMCQTLLVWFWPVAGMMHLGIVDQHCSDFPVGGGGAVINDPISNVERPFRVIRNVFRF